MQNIHDHAIEVAHDHDDAASQGHACQECTDGRPTGSVACPFCCQSFKTEAKLLVHVKKGKCIAKENGFKQRRIDKLESEVRGLKSTVETLVAQLAQVTSRLEAVANNDIEMIERFKALSNAVAQAPHAPRRGGMAANKRARAQEDTSEGSESTDDTQAASDAEPDSKTNTQPTANKVQQPPRPPAAPFDRATIAHVTLHELAKCVRDYECSGLRYMAQLVYFNPKVPRNASVSVKTAQCVHIMSDDGNWEPHSKASALKRVVRQVLNLLSAKLDDPDTQDELVEDYKVSRSKVEQIIEDVDACINDASGKKHKKFFDDVWSVMLDNKQPHGRRAAAQDT
jgi:uncharacterized coiled-coil protein SlyX